MSQCSDTSDETLWNPSNGASRTFLRQVAVFEAELQLPSGVGSMENDECQISPDTFAGFIDALLARHRETSHAVWSALSEGFTATLLVLAKRAAIDVDWTQYETLPETRAEDVQITAGSGTPTPVAGTARTVSLRDTARELGRHMPC